MKVVVVGAGWAGCAAAVAARKQGAQVTLIERTDMLIGTGLVGGIMGNNGRFTAAEEMLAMSGGDLFKLIDGNLLHKGISFPGHHHASLYNVASMEPIVRHQLEERGIEVLVAVRVDDVEMEGARIEAVTGKAAGARVRLEGDAFIDATGTAGPQSQCTKYGNGCAMCILRCPSFGGRVSVTARCGVREMIGRKGGRIGAMSGSCELLKESLSREIVGRLDEEGIAVIPIPGHLRLGGKVAIKACQQYASPEFEENLVILDTGHAKLMTPFFPLEALRRMPGMENARYEDPCVGGLGNSIRYVGMAPRDDALKVSGVENLFCAGEKAGLLVGHTEAIVTGTLAGYNAARISGSGRPLVLPATLATGDAIAHVRTRMADEEGLGYKYTFSGSVYFERMKEKGLYSLDVGLIQKRVDEAGLTGAFA